MRKIVGAAIIALALGVLGQADARGQETSTQASQPESQQPPPAAASPWSFRLTSYLWLAGLNGDVGVGGLPPADIDVGFSEIFNSIDWFPPPVMLAGEVRYGRFAFLTDFIYLGLKGDGTSPGGLLTAEADMHTVVWTFGGSFRVIQYDPVTLDLLAGGRLWNLGADLTLTGPQAVPRQASGSKTWVDPIIGISGRVNLGSGFALQAEGDVGGFGVAADLDWQVLGTLQYQLNDSIALEAGYRYLAVDFSDGGFLFDVAMHGPIIGASIRF